MMDAPSEDGENMFSKISYSDEGTFGDYDLAEKLLDVEYTNLDIAKRIRKYVRKTGGSDDKLRKDYSQVEEFCFAHF